MGSGFFGRMKLRVLGVVVLILSFGLLVGCNPEIFVPVPQYPSYQSEEAVKARAQQYSDDLEAHVEAWLNGTGPSRIPDEILPNGKSPNVTNFRVVRPEDVTPEDVWLIRESEQLNFNGLQGLFWDPNATYGVIPAFYLPYGHKMIVEGEFPRSRFFSLQASPPFDPTVYRYDNAFGAAEVPILDVDIEPLPGHTNPFRVGADRNAEDRSYRVEWTMTEGNGPELEPAYRPPWRASGNERLASTIQYQGPWGKPGTPNGLGRGEWNVGAFWMRYYAPDKDAGPLGGVPLPEVTYQTPEGEEYLIVADKTAEEADLNARAPLGTSPPSEPKPAWDSDVGWFKSWGIFHSIASGGTQQLLGVDSEQGRAYVRRLQLGVTGRGQNQPAPGNYAASASDAVNINYLTRGMSLEENHVAVIAGKLPTTPDTRDGAPTMEAAEARYFSITGYDPRLETPKPGTAVTSVMDDEMVTNDEGWYAVAYSRAGDRPANATAGNGVTWKEWGTLGELSFTLRWMTVAGGWESESVPTPTEKRLTWAETAWSGTEYDPTILGQNNRQGFLGEYQPVIHYMTQEEFEALGPNIDPRILPKWEGK